MSEANQQQQQLPATVEINDLNAFVKHLTAWHTQKVKTLEHLMSIPDGTEVSMGDGPAVILTGVTMTAFQAGINTSLIELGTLPFVAELEADEPVPV